MFHKSTNNKNERGKLWHIIWTIVTAMTLILGGVLIASYMVISEKISIESANIIANVTIFASVFVAMLTQSNREGKLWRSGLHIVGVIIVFLLADVIFYDGATKELLQRICAMIVSVSLFVIITSRKGKKHFRRRWQAG